MRFRHGAAERAAAVIWLAAGSAVATARWWLAPLLLLPLIAVLATFRRGTDVEDSGVTVHALLTRRHLPWEGIQDLRAAGRRVRLVRTDGRSIVLPAVRPADLAVLVKRVT
jgi:hypothetical protein